MSMQWIKFKPCPECSENEKPSIAHDVEYTGIGNPEFQSFYAICRTCGYTTKKYDHVVELVSAWNVDSINAWPPITKKGNRNDS